MNNEKSTWEETQLLQIGLPCVSPLQKRRIDHLLDTRFFSNGPKNNSHRTKKRGKKKNDELSNLASPLSLSRSSNTETPFGFTPCRSLSSPIERTQPPLFPFLLLLLLLARSLWSHMMEEQPYLLLQRYRRDRRNLLEFLFSSSLIKELRIPAGHVTSISDLDFDNLSADYILHSIKSG